MIVVEYDGTGFFGWQVQPHRRTVQAELQKAARRIFGRKVTMTGAGRTDKGVHASGQTINFRADSVFTAFRLCNAFNAVLPSDISVVKAKIVSDTFNARYRAKNKIYEYRIWNRPLRSAMAQRYSWHVISPLDVSLMRSAAHHLEGRHDFSAFAGSQCSQENRVVVLKKIGIMKRNGYIILRFEADRFLYKMVRNITGTLVEAGKGRITAAHFSTILASGDRRNAGPTAPPQGLELKKVVY